MHETGNTDKLYVPQHFPRNYYDRLVAARYRDKSTAGHADDS
jgi:hypothetical protein